VGIIILFEHSIDTGNAKPMKQRHYSLSMPSEKLLCVEIDRSDGRGTFAIIVVVHRFDGQAR